MPLKDPDARREYNRHYHASHGYRTYNRESMARHRHGDDIEAAWAAMWETQQGCCYLCGDPLTEQITRIDHDYRCCPYKKSCSICRRGLACDACNLLIGKAQDDPERLHRIADNLAAAIALVTERLRSAPEQMTLIDN